MSLTHLEIAVPNCSAEDFDGEIVAINLETGRYFSIRDSAALIWNDLVAGHTVEAIGAAVATDAALAAATEQYVSDLLKEGLMRAKGAPGAPGTALLSSPGMGQPVLESFGDMESLLLLDPVHEVDDTEGWPKQREE